MNLFAFIFLLSLLSCSSMNKNFKDYSLLGEPRAKDYIDHLASAGPDYLDNEDIKEVRLNKDSLRFFEEIYQRLVTNNEQLLEAKDPPSFHVIISKNPFIFSLPRGQFFISSGLVEKYFKSEDLFVAAIAAEVLKSDRNIYEKKLMIPLGFYSTEKIIQLTRLRPETKYQLNEWTYFILKRAGFDSSAYLNWIQIQNRNTLDFSLLLGDPVGISKEEHLFKNFMAKQGVVSIEKKINEANSSKAYYKLLNNIASSK